jgi:hypothetical protein
LSEDQVKSSSRNLFASLSLSIACFFVAACGSGVKGHTYAGPGGMVQIEFQSDGKAFASTGGLTSNCTYTQDGNKVTLSCEGVTEVLTLGSDGALSGPPDGMLARLTKVK